MLYLVSYAVYWLIPKYSRGPGLCLYTLDLEEDNSIVLGPKE